jgi:hypothetical protein
MVGLDRELPQFSIPASSSILVPFRHSSSPSSRYESNAASLTGLSAFWSKLRSMVWTRFWVILFPYESMQ